jgi:hypothetical protein
MTWEINPTEVAKRIINLIREQAVIGKKEASRNTETIIQFVMLAMKAEAHTIVILLCRFVCALDIENKAICTVKPMFTSRRSQQL